MRIAIDVAAARECDRPDGATDLRFPDGAWRQLDAARTVQPDATRASNGFTDRSQFD